MIQGDGGKRYDRFRDRDHVPDPRHPRPRDRLRRPRARAAASPSTSTRRRRRCSPRAASSTACSWRATRSATPASVVVVEGYMDVVALAQHGVEYAVATLGTSTTPAHAQKLFRLTDTVVFCFDGDDAGRKAAWRALENALPELADGKNARFLFLPDGEDPDDYVRTRGKAAFEQRARQGACRLSEFLLAELVVAPSAGVGRRARGAGGRRAAVPRADRGAGARGASCASGWPSISGLADERAAAAAHVAGAARRPPSRRGRRAGATAARAVPRDGRRRSCASSSAGSSCILCLRADARIPAAGRRDARRGRADRAGRAIARQRATRPPPPRVLQAFRRHAARRRARLDPARRWTRNRWTTRRSNPR